jgi:hypothetical protein
LRGKLIQLEQIPAEPKGCHIKQSAKQISGASQCASPQIVNEAPRILGLLTGKAKEAPDGWDQWEDIDS